MQPASSLAYRYHTEPAHGGTFGAASAPCDGSSWLARSRRRDRGGERIPPRAHPTTDPCEHRAHEQAAIPQYHELMWPVLEAQKELGGSATVKEIYERVVEDQRFSEEQQAVSTKDGRMSEIEYRLHWARTHLKAIGAIENSTRRVWAITEKGRSVTLEQMHAETRAWRAEIRDRRAAKSGEAQAEDADSASSRPTRAHATVYATGVVDLEARMVIDMVDGNAAADLRRWTRKCRSQVVGRHRRRRY